MGWAPVTGVDHDPASVEAARANASANGVAVNVRRVDLRTHPGPHAPTVVANLMRPLLLTVAEHMEHAPERLIVSGALVEEADEVAAAFAARGMTERERRTDGEWAALLLASIEA